MNTKIARIQDMLASGWDVDDIGSDADGIAVLLQRGTARQAIVLDQQDAWEVLFGDGLRGAPARHDRPLVVGQLH